MSNNEPQHRDIAYRVIEIDRPFSTGFAFAAGAAVALAAVGFVVSVVWALFLAALFVGV